jgi:hypothetical protein
MAPRHVASVVSLAAFVFLARPLLGQTGNLRVVVSTEGASVDPDGYVVALDSLRQAVSVNGSVVFIKVTPGSHAVLLLDLAEGCAVREGNLKTVAIAEGSTEETGFDVVCGQRESVLPPVRREPPPLPRTEIRPTAGPTAPSVLPIGYFAAGYWIGTVEPPGFASYPVRWTFYSEQELGEAVGEAVYESPSPCSYDLILEFVGTAELVVAQQLVSGDCANGTRVILRRDGEKLWAYWLRPDKSAWFEAELSRISPRRP